MPQQALPTTDARRYWRVNLYLLGTLLPVWFIVSFGLSIFWVEALNEFRLGGFPLGFWISQQGAIYLFVLLILIYAVLMGRVDRRYHAREAASRAGASQDSSGGGEG